jgi:hypothetical protein
MYRHLFTIGLFLALVLALSACVIEPGESNWCYYHPHRC